MHVHSQATSIPLTETQKAKIIEYLSTNPALASVILNLASKLSEMTLSIASLSSRLNYPSHSPVFPCASAHPRPPIEMHSSSSSPQPLAIAIPLTEQAEPSALSFQSRAK
ncbi:hypothetical protein NE237_031938 [Protea cynaroides]|uniref:Uncharacterized protein n=1 Tax=Protea cynaroides TaxID=273540 RepID=A0A9Q0L2J8_9MAGN|nr:hypothetical protein NE237_031938 [Protea cynaroides]